MRGENFSALLAFEIGEEDDAVIVMAAHQHHADIGHAVAVHRRQRHGRGVIGFSLFSLLQPIREIFHRVVVHMVTLS